MKTAECCEIIVNADLAAGTIDKNIYGHFAEHLGRCIYEGIWVGKDSEIPNTRGIRKDVVEALRALEIPVLRWPGGCFADEYHWKDGIGPAEQRPAMVNTHWGGVVENNHFGTHEFLDLCEMIGAEPYICGNVGSGTVQEMQQWVEYITCEGGRMADLRSENGRTEPWILKYFGVGNENWGCGGRMRPEYYADLYRRYQTYIRNFGDNKIFKIACGPSGDDYRWTEVMMREAGKMMHGLALHYYTKSRGQRDFATGFSENQWFTTMKKTLFMEELIQKHCAVMDRYDPSGRVALIVDEWGTWHEVEPGTNPRFLYQQNTMRDALVAGINLNIFNSYCKRVKMANIAQTVNVLQAMVLTDGAKMLLTPSYHVFEMYRAHHGATLLDLHLKRCPEYENRGEVIPQVSVSASMDNKGAVNISLCNLHPVRTVPVTCELRGMKPGRVEGGILAAAEIDAHNTFDEPTRVRPADFGAASLSGGNLETELPPACVAVLRVV